MTKRTRIFLGSCIAMSLIFTACNEEEKKVFDEASQVEKNIKKIEETQTELIRLLEDESLSPETRYAVVKNIAINMKMTRNTDQMILFLTEWVENHPEDPFNAYWLLKVAEEYNAIGSKPIAEYYYDRILQNYTDLTIDGKSIHHNCLKNLINISVTPAHRITYFNQLITRFPSNENITEMYVRIAMEYEKEGEWKSALKSYAMFLNQPDASTIQIPGIPEAYSTAKKMVDFDKSPKDWTFESLEALEKAVKKAISRYDWRSLDKYRSKVNFFAMSWKQNETAENAQESFSMQKFMTGQRIRYNERLDETSNPNEAYLRSTGWSPYMPVWYLYFRKINFPVDPDIHGRWEWAGIYYGEKM